MGNEEGEMGKGGTERAKGTMMRGDDVKITGEQITLPLECCNVPTVSLC